MNKGTKTKKLGSGLLICLLIIMSRHSKAIVFLSTIYCSKFCINFYCYTAVHCKKTYSKNSGKPHTLLKFKDFWISEIKMSNAFSW